MAPTEVNIDYYAVLEISNFATIDVVIKSYRRLAKLRHPDRNHNADSTAVFQLVSLTSRLIESSTKVVRELTLLQQSFKTPTKRSAIPLKDERTISDGPVSEIVSGHGRSRNGAKPKPHKQSKSEQLKRGRESRQ